MYDDNKESKALDGPLLVCWSELDIADRRQKREIRHLEQELPKWQVLVDSVTGQNSYLLSLFVYVAV